MELVDAHCHLDAPAFDDDRAAVVARARAAGVRSWVVAGTRPSCWRGTQQTAEATGGRAVLGVHPWFAAEATTESLTRLATLAPEGIGEIGLDGLAATSDDERALQRAAFRAQLALARERDVPVVIHCVKAVQEVLEVVRADGLPFRGGMIHGWSGSRESAEAFVRAGLCVSFGPLVCRPRARRAREAAAAVPVERLLVETDAPDQAPPGEERGEPAHARVVVEELARIRGVEPAALAAATRATLQRLFAS